MDRPVIILGLGNPLMGDDGAGLAALEALRAHCDFGAGVVLEDGGTLGLELLPLVEDAGSLLVLDAVRLGGAAGTTVVRTGDQIPRCFSHKLSPHQIGFRETLALAGLRGNLPRRFTLVGVEVTVALYAEPLSPTVLRALPAMVAAAIAQLASWGCAARPNLLPRPNPLFGSLWGYGPDGPPSLQAGKAIRGTVA
jgi:hydrogenase maturation protease